MHAFRSYPALARQAAVLAWLVFLALPVLATDNPVFRAEKTNFQLETIADGLEHPWCLAFMPGGDLLVTERAGRLRIIRGGKLLPQPVPGAPTVAATGQGGLLDVLLHPDFDSNRTLFLSYAHKSDKGLTTRVARAVWNEDSLQNLRVIFEALPRSRTTRHFGGRMAFDAAGNLYISVGDRGQKDRAQDTRDDAGGVHRITTDGKPAPGNPGIGKPDVNNTLFTWGNRNIQGMTVHPGTGDIWTHEHGPRGGDEINILRRGTNYGWPEITFGIGYSGLPISLHTAKEGMA